jgi:hypothetical protein
MNKDHIIIDLETGNSKCLRCGDVLYLSRLYPISIVLICEIMKTYIKIHSKCKLERDSGTSDASDS